MAIVTTDDKHYKAMADIIREYGDTPEVAADVTQYLPEEIPDLTRQVMLAQYSRGLDEGYSDGHFAGQISEYDRFWDAYQQNGGRTDYTNAFRNYLWTDVTYNPKHSIKAERLASCFQTCNQIKSTKVPIQYISNRQESSVFNGCTNLVTIPSITVREANTFSSWFQGCSALENITFGGTIGQNIDTHWSEKLTKASIESIMVALSTTTTDKSVSFSKAAVNKAFETSEGANDGSTSAEWTALANTRSNWTINLV